MPWLLSNKPLTLLSYVFSSFFISLLVNHVKHLIFFHLFCFGHNRLKHFLHLLPWYKHKYKFSENIRKKKYWTMTMNVMACCEVVIVYYKFVKANKFYRPMFTNERCWKKLQTERERKKETSTSNKQKFTNNKNEKSSPIKSCKNKKSVNVLIATDEWNIESCFLPAFCFSNNLIDLNSVF